MCASTSRKKEVGLGQVIKKLQLGDGICGYLGLSHTKDKESILLHL